MRRFALLVAALTAGPALADEHAHHGAPAAPGDAQIVVTVNPEARVSAVLGVALPPPPQCGDAAELKVRIVNQGMIKAPLRARLVGDGARYAAIHMEVVGLSGAAEEDRRLHVIPTQGGPVDLTVAFSFDDKSGDLAGRDRVHFLLNCKS